mmetsp:Transcript_158507/g.279839  ORF Transcript_158507/g.279839 Transcript_158507/m.279839 type:complete len:1079 (+) Transcript_158507:222-3458(+)
MAVQAAGWDSHIATRDHRQELDMTGMDMSPPMVGSWVPVKTQALREEPREGAGDDSEVGPSSLSLGAGSTFFSQEGSTSNYAEPPTGPGSPRSRSALPVRTTTMWAPSSWAPSAGGANAGDSSNAGEGVNSVPVTGMLAGPPRGEALEESSHVREGRSASPAPPADNTTTDQSTSEAQALYSIGEHVLYWSDTHKQWMDAKVTRQNFDARGNLLTYDLDVKRGAQAAKIRRLPPPGEPWPQPPSAQVSSKAAVSTSAGQKAPTPAGHSIAAAPAGEERVGTKETPPSVGGPGASGPPPQAINKEDQRLLPRFEEGDRVAYWSDTYEQWMQATVERIRDDGVTYDLDVKRGAQRRKMKPLRWGDPQTVPAAVAVQMRTSKAQNDPRAQTRGPSPLSGRARGLSCEPADRAESVAPLQVDLGAARPVQSGDSGGYPRIGSQVLVANDSHLPTEYAQYTGGTQSYSVEGNALPTATSLVNRARVQPNNVVTSSKPKNDFGRPVYNGTTGPVYSTGVPPKVDSDGRRVPTEVGPTTISTRPQTEAMGLRAPTVGSTPQVSRVVGAMSGPGASPATSVGLPGTGAVRVFTEMQTSSAVTHGTHVSIGGTAQAGGSDGTGGVSPKKVQVTIMPNGQVTSTGERMLVQQQETTPVPTPTAVTAAGRPSLAENKADEGPSVAEPPLYVGQHGLEKRTPQELAALAHHLGIDRGPAPGTAGVSLSNHSAIDSDLASRVAAALARLPLREIRRQLSEAHVDTSLCKEKQELEALLAETLIRQSPTAAAGVPITTTLRTAPSPSPSPSPAPTPHAVASAPTAGPHRVDPAAASGQAAGLGIRVGDLDIGAGAFDPTQPSLRAQLIGKMGCTENSSIEEMTGFRGGLNEGVWFLSDMPQGVADHGRIGKQEFVLKLVRCYRISPKVLTEAENFLKMAKLHPTIVTDTSVAFPIWIFSCLGPDKSKRYDLIVMWKARGERLAELIAHKWYMKQFDVLWGIFEKLGLNLGSFHRRYGNAQHGDFQPSNIFYDEKEDKISLIDVGGMGVLTMENDVEHFAKALKLLAEAYGPQLISEGLRAFETGYARAVSAR